MISTENLDQTNHFIRVLLVREEVRDLVRRELQRCRNDQAPTGTLPLRDGPNALRWL
jgi:hypothetical protein